nr:hypothetical protein [Tanacetum cinerariifolium]
TYRVSSLFHPSELYIYPKGNRFTYSARWCFYVNLPRYRISWRKQRQKKQQKLQNENHGRSLLKLSKNRRSVIECDASIRKGLERAFVEEEQESGGDNDNDNDSVTAKTRLYINEANGQFGMGWPPRVTLGRLLPHARGLGFKPRREGFPSGAKKEWGLSPKAKVRVLHTAQLDVTVRSNH